MGSADMARRRAAGSDPARTAGTPVVIVGAVGTEPWKVLDTVVDAPDIGLAALATSQTWVLLRAGATASATALVPGQRRPRRVEPGGTGIAAVARPPRRIDVEHPAKLLERMLLAGAPEVGDADPAGAEVVADAVERAAGLVFVAGAAPFEHAQVDLLRRAARTGRLAFVLVGGDGERCSGAVAEKRAQLAEHAPALAAAPWYTVTAPVSPEAAAAGVGELEALRRRITEWGDQPARFQDDASAGGAPPPGTRVPRPRHRAAPAVPSDDRRWRETLDREIAARYAAADQCVGGEISRMLGRCTRAIGSPSGCAGVPVLLDRELHALSVRVTRRLEEDASEIIRRVCAALLQTAPDAAVLARVRTGVRRVIEADGDAPAIHALLLTTTSGVAAVSGREALDGMVTLGLAAERDPLLTPIEVAVSSSCYRMWRTAEVLAPERCRDWLRRAHGVVETELLREIRQRFDELRQGLDIVATDAVDHGFLLV